MRICGGCHVGLYIGDLGELMQSKAKHTDFRHVLVSEEESQDAEFNLTLALRRAKSCAAPSHV